MRSLAAAALVAALFLAPGSRLPAPAQAQTVKYLNTLPAAGAVAGTNTLPLCQTAGGCGSGNALTSATIAQLNTYFQAQLSATAPLTFGSGVIALASQNANQVLAGPGSGSGAAPAFRALVAADMPATPPHYQTGSYTLASTDLNNPVCLTGSGSATFTMPAPTTAAGPFAPGAIYVVCNLSTGQLTLATSGGSFLGLATNPLTQNMWTILTSDGTNWLAMER